MCWIFNLGAPVKATPSFSDSTFSPPLPDFDEISTNPPSLAGGHDLDRISSTSSHQRRAQFRHPGVNLENSLYSAETERTIEGEHFPIGKHWVGVPTKALKNSKSSKNYRYKSPHSVVIK